MTLVIKRFTTSYSENEDRISIHAETDQSDYVVMWLSRRMLDRLIPALIEKIDSSDQRDAHHAMLQAFNQEAAVAAIKPSEPVTTQKDQKEFVVLSVDIHTNDELVTMVFSYDSALFRLGLNKTELRQWLWIIYKNYIRAEWSSNIWPKWFLGEKTTMESVH